MPQKRNKKIQSEEEKRYSEALKRYRSISARHVLTFEAALPENNKRKLFAYSDRLRLLSNEITDIMQKRYGQMSRTKQCRGARKEYGAVAEALKKAKEGTPDAEKLGLRKKALAEEINTIAEKYGVTFEQCRLLSQEFHDKYDVGSIPALTAAEDAWKGVGKVLYCGADRLHFHSYGDLPAIRCKQISRGIILHYGKDGKPYFSFDGMELQLKDYSKDRFIQDELAAVARYMEMPEANDRKAVSAFLESKGKDVPDTFRPCCASIVVRRIRNKIRIYIHLTIEGHAVPKYDRYGRLRHVWGEGRVGCDIGTQTAAWTPKSEVGLSNLAERGDTITHQERKERLLYRAMDRSRRANNPDNYNPDGTVKKGPKVWHNSKNYRKLRHKHEEMCRRNADSRKYGNREMANHMRTLGDEFITEPPNAAKLAKKTEISEKTGKYKRKKRFGRSIKNRCPGRFQADVKALFENTGGSYHEVGAKFRASQYDHTVDDHIRKKLNQRMYSLQKGPRVQRDWYSSFLMFCSDEKYENASRDQCIDAFAEMYAREQAMVDKIRASGKKVMNSGIRPAVRAGKRSSGVPSVRLLPVTECEKAAA